MYYDDFRHCVSAAVSAIIMAPGRLRVAFSFFLQTCYIAFILVLAVCWPRTWIVCEGVLPY